MKSSVRMFFILCFLLSAAAGVSREAVTQEKDINPKDLIGAWDLTVIDEAGYEQLSTITFIMKNDSLSGEWSSPEFGECAVKNIKIDKNKFTCEIVIDTGYEFMSIYVSGTVTGDTMKGTAELEGMEYPYTAKKRKEK